VLDSLDLEFVRRAGADFSSEIATTCLSRFFLDIRAGLPIRLLREV